MQRKLLLSEATTTVALHATRHAGTYAVEHGVNRGGNREANARNLQHLLHQLTTAGSRARELRRRQPVACPANDKPEERAHNRLQREGHNASRRRVAPAPGEARHPHWVSVRSALRQPHAGHDNDGCHIDTG